MSDQRMTDGHPHRSEVAVLSFGLVETVSTYPFGRGEGQALLACEDLARGRLTGFVSCPRCSRQADKGKRHIRS